VAIESALHISYPRLGRPTAAKRDKKQGEFVGGCDIVREMFQAGELQQALKEKGVAMKADTAA
jgi:hypothetical protein